MTILNNQLIYVIKKLDVNFNTTVLYANDSGSQRASALKVYHSPEKMTKLENALSAVGIYFEKPELTSTISELHIKNLSADFSTNRNLMLNLEGKYHDPNFNLKPMQQKGLVLN